MTSYDFNGVSYFSPDGTAQEHVYPVTEDPGTFHTLAKQLMRQAICALADGKMADYEYFLVRSDLAEDRACALDGSLCP